VISPFGTVKKNILIIGPYPPPYGGVATHLQFLVEDLLKNGWSVSLLQLKFGKSRHTGAIDVYKVGIFATLFRLMKYLFIRTEYNFLLSDRSFSLIRNIKIYFKCIAIDHLVSLNNFQLITVYHLFPSAYLASLVARSRKVSLIVNNLGEIFKHKQFFTSIRDKVEFTLNSAGIVIAPTRHCARAYSEIGLEHDVKVLHHSIRIHENLNAKKRLAFLSEHHFGDNDIIVLYFSRISIELGIDTLVESFPTVISRDPRIKFLVAGQKGDGVNLIKKLQMSYPEKCISIFNVPEDLKPYLYSVASIVVVPSKNDRACGSLTAAEAMVHSKPVIATEEGGIPEFVVNNYNGLLIPADSARELADSILFLAANESLRKQLGEAGRKHVEAWDREIINRQYLEIFDRFAGLPGTFTSDSQ
jgi:glycosyltransferase involved in cell wall biosynthesis